MAAPPDSDVQPLRLVITGLRTMLLLLSLWELALSTLLLPPSSSTTAAAAPSSSSCSLIDTALAFYGQELRALVGQVRARVALPSTSCPLEASPSHCSVLPPPLLLLRIFLSRPPAPLTHPTHPTIQASVSVVVALTAALLVLLLRVSFDASTPLGGPWGDMLLFRFPLHPPPFLLRLYRLMG